MGILVTAAKLSADTKPQYVVSTVAAASVAVDTSAMAVWVGDDFAFSQLETYNAVLKCLERIRENGSPTPLTTNVSGAETLDPSKAAVTLLNDAAIAAAEAEVAVYYGATYQPANGGSVSAHTHRLLELYLESTAKAA